MGARHTGLRSRDVIVPMDSLTQLVLGATVGVAVMGRATRPARAAAWGAVAGTLPDLDVLIDQGDPILDMVLHRAESHAFFWLTLFSLPFAWAVARLHGETDRWRHWWLALWLALVTHPMLDLLTVYGTQVLLPFTDQAWGLGSVFIIDPLVTLPWAIGLGVALRAATPERARRASLVGLSLGVAYLAWGAAVQQHVLSKARDSLRAAGLPAEQVLATPTPFNTLLWRVVSVGDGQYHEGFHSLLDAPGPIRFDRFDQGRPLTEALPGHDGLARIRAFSDGQWALRVEDGRLLLTDLRMGQEPHYVFRFVIGRLDTAGGAWQPVVPVESAGSRAPLGPALSWLWRRMGGTPLAPPR
jgi:inner membrane protein